MLSVTDLTAYLFCPRKLYFKKVLGIHEKPKERTLQGTIIHRVLERSGRDDKDILCSFTEKSSLDDLELRYRRVYSTALIQSIQEEKNALRIAGLDPIAVYHELWPSFLKEAQAKSASLFSHAHEKKVFKELLWNSLPKSAPEIKIVSETLGLVGVIDQLDENFVPIEIKTGKPPRDGVWKEHMVQLGAYMLLLTEHAGKEVNHGFVDYRAVNERRKIVMNPFLKDEILALIPRVNFLLQQSALPEKVKEEWKCKKCGIRETCLATE